MKGLRTYLTIGSALLIIYIVAQLNRPRAVDWTESYFNNKKTPYGTYVLYNRLNDIFPGAQITTYRQPVYNVIADDSIKQSTYIIICQGIDLSQSDYDQLIKYIKQGNDVFISAEYFGSLFEKNLDIKTERYVKFSNNGTPVSFSSPRLNPQKEYILDRGIGGISFSKFDTARAIVLGGNNQHRANFIKYNLGKGSLYLAANPKLFTNYSLLKPDGAAYAATALSFVKNTSHLVWDIYYTQGDVGETSFMRVFLKDPVLQWAYYISIFSLIIFVLYEIKRRQRIIPVIEPLRNSTLEFVTVVGQLYYEKHDNINIAEKKILYLLTYLRDQYNLKTSKLDSEFVEKLSAKVGIDQAFAADLVSYIQYITVQQRITDQELSELNKLIEQFYIQSR